MTKSQRLLEQEEAHYQAIKKAIKERTDGKDNILVSLDRVQSISPFPNAVTKVRQEYLEGTL